MNFERDIFISYAHIDNQAVTDDQEGWVSLLHRGLEIRLAQLRGKRPDIWRDLKLQGNDDFSDTLLDQFPNLALLVAVLSPRYIQSEWCLRELEHFHKAAQAKGGLKVGENKFRIFKVIKTFVPVEKHPMSLDRLLGYPFFELDGAGRPQEFSNLYGSEAEQKFWIKLNDLAYDIHQTLEILEALPEDGPIEITPVSPLVPDGKVIYLAETTPDLQSEWERVRRELEQAGHRVLPDQPLPDPPAFEQAVRQNLAQAALSVHLLSPYPSGQLPGQEPTLEQIYRQMAIIRSRDQVKLAAQRIGEQTDFSRILWLPPDADATPDDFILGLQNEPDFLSTNLESLKDIIHERLTQPPPLLEPDLLADGTVQVYLDCDARDLETPDIEPLYDWLEQNFRVVLPDFEANGVTRSETLLQQCEAVLIYCGRASGLWLKRRLLALKKTRYGRPKPLLAKAVYLADPTKQHLSDPDVPLIQGFGGFEPTLLEDFMAALGTTGGHL